MFQRSTRSLPGLFCACLALYALYLFRLTGAGLMGPDEPRYAAIGREMASSGDWITPRLWGSPWFEKPALLYWMTAVADRAGLSADLAPRLPVALMSIAFLFFFFFQLRKDFGQRVAWFATLILATSAFWVVYSQAAVPDLPLAATFSASVFLLLPAFDDRPLSKLRLASAAAMLGLAVLAKGLVPLVLYLPLVWLARRRLWELVRPAPIILFLAVALPWYVLCYMRNGAAFLETFFLQHQLGRFTSDALQHAQPFWFYVPIALLAVFPWTALLVAVVDRSIYSDRRVRALVATVIFGFLFFSLSRNKLPGYLLPLLPALAALMGIALARRRRAGGLLFTCVLGFVLVPIVAGVLPQAFTNGARQIYPIAEPVAAQAALAIPLLFLVGITVFFLDVRRRRLLACAVVASLSVIAVVYLKIQVLPDLDAAASARHLWRELPKPPASVCVGPVSRAWRYGLNYYTVEPLPDCASTPARVSVEPGPRGPEIMLK